VAEWGRLARGARVVIPGRAQHEPGIHRAAERAVKWIPGSRYACPGMMAGATSIRISGASTSSSGSALACAHEVASLMAVTTPQGSFREAHTRRTRGLSPPLFTISGKSRMLYN
jgi:hypothetical protein